jgi:hypothetical protein
MVELVLNGGKQSLVALVTLIIKDMVRMLQVP